ncbi:response regulator [Spirosoma sp. HMF3257]|uniref:DNA-binding response regulator n=2 Tax=Spirosoma telluris TaxID=2183553 RepID=A0A327NJK7_9BACT|nr:response regulator [Spirosoma telluris]RAI75560.1 DNA-binding response regulator [Spirosoma telluris]
MKLRCVAIDDEPLALEILADDLSRIDFLEVAGTFLSAVDAQEFLNDEAVDLVFSDIRMPTLSGTQFLRGLENPPMFIFTTAYENFAVEGFELNVVDYLLKPIPFDRLRKSAKKALELYRLQKNDQQKDAFFFVFSEYRKIKIIESQILYIEGLKDYVKIFLANRPKPILTRQNLKKIETQLTETKFYRVHQSYIVAVDKITSTQKNSLMIGSVTIPIGGLYEQTFNKKYYPR